MAAANPSVMDCFALADVGRRPKVDLRKKARGANFDIDQKVLEEVAG